MGLIFTILEIVVVAVVIGVAVGLRFRSRRIERITLVVGLVAVIVVTSPITVAWGIWVAAATTCGHPPVAASRFAAAYTYDTPGQSGYGVGLFPIIVPDYYCTESDAQAHGFQHDPHP
jgi:hypothetical protein